MPKAEKVPTYQLTPEQVQWSKNYKKLMQVSKLLNDRLFEQMAGAASYRDMLGQVENQMNQLINKTPRSPVETLEAR